MKKILLLVSATILIGCTSKPQEQYPAFTLEWSEYPSWSALDVAGTTGLFNPEQGAPYSEIETKYQVDIVLKRRDYLQSLKEYASGLTDAVCVTNIDCLNLVKGRPSTTVLPTSTSFGADGIIVSSEIKSIDDLKGHTTYGAEDSVSEFVWYRGLENAGKDPKEYEFKHMEPDAAAIAMQNGSKDVQSIAVWEPFRLQTLRTNESSKLLFDSSNIKLEVVDMVLVGNDVLKREGGERFAEAVCASFYEICRLMETEQKEKIVVGIGKKFCNLNYEDMQIVLQKCVFFSSKESGSDLFNDKGWHEKMINVIVPNAVNVGIIKQEEMPSVGFDDSTKDLNFTDKFLIKSY